MSITNANISTIFGNAATAVYTSSGNTCVTTFYICNSSTTSVLVNLYAVPSGGTANLRSQIYGNITIAAGDTYIADTEKLIFGASDTLNANANAATFITLSYTAI